jgi:hypothetical protein
LRRSDITSSRASDFESDEPKVADVWHIVVIQQYIPTFEVPVDDAGGMQMLHRLGHPEGNDRSSVRRELPEAIVERTSQKFGDDRKWRRQSDSEKAQDRGMIQRGHRPDLSLESLELAPTQHLRIQYFDRHFFTRRNESSDVNPTKSATAYSLCDREIVVGENKVQFRGEERGNGDEGWTLLKSFDWADGMQAFLDESANALGMWRNWLIGHAI